MAKLNKTVIAALKDIKATGRVSQDVGKPLLEQNLIEVNTGDVVDGKAAARLTAAGEAGIADKAKPSTVEGAPSAFTVMTGIALPESKRGNRGATGAAPKYPFATMEIGQFIFIPGAEAAKKLGSTVSNANNKFRVSTGATETKIRTKRGKGNKAELDATGAKIKEEVIVPVYNYTRKFVLRPVEKGVKYGDFTAPDDGVVIARQN